MIKIRNNSLDHKSIDIDISKGVSIHLYGNEYNNLCRLLCDDLKEQFNISTKRLENADKIREQCISFKNEIVKVFYDYEDGDDWAVKRQAKNINEDRLSDVLEKYARFLGFE